MPLAFDSAQFDSRALEAHFEGTCSISLWVSGTVVFFIAELFVFVILLQIKMHDTKQLVFGQNSPLIFH